jgi:type IV secretory pathway TraG/TraD family ATPase VirD4
MSNLGTWAIFAQGDPKTADYLSQYLGDEEIRRMVHSVNKNASLFKDSSHTKTASEQILRQRAVIPSELIQMPTLKCIVNVSGELPPARTRVPFATAPKEPQPAIQISKTFRPMQIVTASSRAALAAIASAAQPEPVIDDTNL